MGATRVTAPWKCSNRIDIIGDGSEPINLFWGYIMGALIMIAGGVVAMFLGVNAEGKSLEDIASPLAARRTGFTRAEGSARPNLG